MAVTDISGGWLSKSKRVYIITQLKDKFVWRVVHDNGITETGIGWFLYPPEENNFAVKAQWNFHNGQMNADVSSCEGEVIRTDGKATRIQWEDGDHFELRLTD